MPDADLSERIRDRLAAVREIIACHAPDPDAISVVAVTKTFGLDLVEAALDAGLTDLGENYAQELVAKAEHFDQRLVRWHAIGPVQRNKVKRLVPHVWLWHTVDRADLAAEIAKRAPGSRVLLQVNTTDEESKSGCAPTEVPALADRATEVGLDVVGLMTMGPTDAATDPRPAFAVCRALADRLGLRHCSMGMSRDYPIALEEGATIIRIGTTLFGERT